MMVPLSLATVLLDPPTALLAGCVIALVSAKLIALDPERELGRTALFGLGWGVFYAGCVGWLFFHQPDWMLVYLKDAREVSLLPAFLVFAALCAAHGAFGAVACAALLRQGRRALAWALTAGAVITVGAVFWLQWRQYFLIGTFEQFYAGGAVPLQSDAGTQLAMNVAGGLAGVGSVAMLVVRFLQTKRASAAAATAEYRPPPQV